MPGPALKLSPSPLIPSVLLLVLLSACSARAERINLTMPTMGGIQFWADVKYHGGWRIQINAVTGHCRVLDEKEVRHAWAPKGEHQACEDAFSKAREEFDLQNQSTHAVILLHGLGRRRAMFRTMEVHLEEEGYEVISVAYPSTQATVSGHAAQLEGLLESLDGIDKVSFVTHSLGGIVTRELLTREHVWQDAITPQKFVMLGPPNQGAAMARIAPDWAAEAVMGEAITELRTPLGNNKAPEDVPLGIIAGGRNGRGYNPLIPGDDDGVVGVSETHLDGAADFLLIPGIHSFLPANPAAIEATLEFLKTGQFSA